jgi:hypothetical protein
MPDLGLILCGAVPILLIAAGMWIYNLFILVRYTKTKGTVVGYKTSRSSRGGGGSAEIVQFQGPDGGTIEFTEKAYISRIIHMEGQSVNVLYDPSQPTRARVNKFTSLYLAPLILTVVGALMILFNTPAFHAPIQKLLEWLDGFVQKLPWWL